MSLRGGLKNLRMRVARLPSLRMSAPDAPALPVRDPWPGDPASGARLLRGELLYAGGVRALKPGSWTDAPGNPVLRAHAHGFTWLRDLRVIGTDAARMRARALVADWIETGANDSVASRPDVAGARITAWLSHYDFFAASADDEFRQKMMWRLVTDARVLAAALPAEEIDARAFTGIKGLIAAAIAMPDHAAYMPRAQKFLPQEIGRQILPDGGHIERSPSAHLAVLKDLIETRALLQLGAVEIPSALAPAIERLALGLRTLRHGDGGLALFNGSREEQAALTELVLTQAGRVGRAPASLRDIGFYRLQAGRVVLIADAGAPPPPGQDRLAHAGTLSFEMSIGRDRLIVNCGASPLANNGAWTDAARATAAHSTLIIADTSSSELKPTGLGRRPEHVWADRQEANGAHWLEAHHDGWKKPFGAIHRRRLYMAESGEDIRGEDVIEAATPVPYAVRFHLHPAITASVQQDGEAVLLRLPGAGGGWRLRAEGAKLSLEESIYLGGAEPRRAEQVVLTGMADGPQHVKWAITKVG